MPFMEAELVVTAVVTVGAAVVAAAVVAAAVVAAAVVAAAVVTSERAGTATAKSIAATKRACMMIIVEADVERRESVSL